MQIQSPFALTRLGDFLYSSVDLADSTAIRTTNENSPTAMRSSFASTSLSFGILLAVIVAASSCALPAPIAQNETNRYPSVDLERVNPVDMAVLPIVDQTGGLVPVRLLRNELYVGLTKKFYSPLSLNFVDVNWIEASHDATALGADGVLRVIVEKWDTSLISIRGALAVEIAVEILDGAAPDAVPLWGVRIKRRLEVVNGNQKMSRTEIFDRAAELVAEEILALIPAHKSGSR